MEDEAPPAPSGAGDGTADGAPVRHLDAGASRRRVTATAVVAALLVWGSLWGQDDHFPFGPLRQYSTATDPNGLVWVSHAYGRFDDGIERALYEDDIGMRVAEFDGQFHRLRTRPELLRPLADTYRRRNPDGPRLVRLRVQRDAKRLSGREVVGRRTRIVAEIWVADRGTFETTRLHGRFTNEDERRIDPLEIGWSRTTFDRRVVEDEDPDALLAVMADEWRETNPRDRELLVGLSLRRERVRIVDGEVVDRSVVDLAELDW